MTRLLLAALVSVAGCALSHEVDPTGGVGAEHVRLRVARLVLAADPAASEPVRILSVESDKARESVLARVTLSGPGTWNAATERLSADVRITNETSGPFDEPEMVVVSITESGADGGVAPETVRVELNDSGGDRLGSLFAFADLDFAGGVNGGSARHPLRFHSPGGVSFTFTVDVFAHVNPPAGNVRPDGDDDGYNTEAGARGEDCDDTDPTVFPGAGGCLCASDCNACEAGGCCESTCQGDCACPAGCDCDYEPGSGGGTSVGCDASTCGLVCGATGGTCEISSCTNATCAVDCRETPALCRIDDCVDASCDVRCEGNEGKCAINVCQSSTCNLHCVDAEAKCEIESCRSGSQCRMQCESTTSACNMSCEEGASCVLTCVDSTSCQLTCAGGESVDCGGGVRACNVDDCP